MSKQALVVIDFINEMVDPSGKLAAKGYAAFIEERSVFNSLNGAIREFADRGDPVIFVTLGFATDWSDQAKGSPIFGKAHEFGILQRGTWSTALHSSVWQPDDALYLHKQRVSAFYGTFLEGLLRNLGVDGVVICGVATDLAVEAAARDAHDRDFSVSVLSAACGAASGADHERSLATMSKFATVL